MLWGCEGIERLPELEILGLAADGAMKEEYHDY